MPTYTDKGYSYGNDPYFRVEVAEVEEGLLKLSVTARRAVKAYLKDVGVPILEKYAKDNAPWTDRTHSAREGLTASVYEKGRANNNTLKQDYTCGIELYHTALNAQGKMYGVYLELGTSHANPYPILGDAAFVAGATVIDGMNNILEKYDGSVFGVDDMMVDVNNDAVGMGYDSSVVSEYLGRFR